MAAALSREMKAQPTERLQTEAELATAEAQRLRMLEAERQRRMQPRRALVRARLRAGVASRGAQPTTTYR